MKYTIGLEKPLSKEPTFIFFRCFCKDGRCVLSLKEKILPSQWNSELQTVTFKSPIATKLAKISRKMHMLAFSGEVLTKAELKKAILDEIGATPQIDKLGSPFIEMIDKIIEERKSGKELNEGQVFKAGTIDTYEKARIWLGKYIAHIYPKSFTMQSFTIADYRGFFEFLTKQPTLSRNSIGLFIAKLRVFLAAGYERNWHTNLVFRDPNFKSTSESTVKVALSMEVLEKMNQMELSGTAARVRDFFLIESFTSLRVGDTMKLTKENISGDTITTISTKTGQTTVVPIHRILADVIARNNGGFPVMEQSIPTYGRYLREVAKNTGMLHDKVLITHTREGRLVKEYKAKWELVTSHTGRRSFVTNTRPFMTRDDRKRMAGIKSEKTMDTYDKSTAEDVANTVKENDFWK